MSLHGALSNEGLTGPTPASYFSILTLCDCDHSHGDHSRNNEEEHNETKHSVRKDLIKG